MNTIITLCCCDTWGTIHKLVCGFGTSVLVKEYEPQALITVPFQFFSSAGILMFYGSLLLLYYLGFGQQKRVLTLLCQLTLVSVVAQYGYQFIKVLFDPKSTTF